jgi:hypothetical protein
MGMVESVTLVKVVRPALDISLAFHVGNRSATESTRGWRSVFFLLVNEQGHIEVSARKVHPLAGQELLHLCDHLLGALNRCILAFSNVCVEA